jgi:hypothetical protein
MITSTTNAGRIASNNYHSAHSENGLGQDLYEYLLVAKPDASVGHRVSAEKENFFDKYQQEGIKRPGSYITVAKYLGREMMEPTLERWVQRICNSQKSFRVVLNNFSGFPPNTLYIRVQNPQPFHSLVSHLKAIETYITDNSGYPVKFAVHPHLPIARKLSGEIYNRALFDYAARDFHETFDVHELLLIKRKNKTDAGQVTNVFRLLPELDSSNYATQLNFF